MKVVDIATEIHLELGEPADTSIASIAYWVRSKVGWINNILFEDFTIDAVTYEIKDGDGEISREAVAIIENLYKVYYYDVQIRSFMNALATDTVLKVEDQGSSVTKVNKNEISKTLAGLKREEQQNLKDLITAYRLKKSTPAQIAGDDTFMGFYDGNGYDLDSRIWYFR